MSHTTAAATFVHRCTILVYFFFNILWYEVKHERLKDTLHIRRLQENIQSTIQFYPCSTLPMTQSQQQSENLRITHHWASQADEKM